MDDLLQRMTPIFRDVLDNDALALRDDLTAKDVEEWDSLNHVKLVIAIENGFKVKFTTREISSWQNVGDMKRTLQQKLAKA